MLNYEAHFWVFASKISIPEGTDCTQICTHKRNVVASKGVPGGSIYIPCKVSLNSDWFLKWCTSV